MSNEPKKAVEKMDLSGLLVGAAIFIAGVICLIIAAI